MNMMTIGEGGDKYSIKQSINVGAGGRALPPSSTNWADPIYTWTSSSAGQNGQVRAFLQIWSKHLYLIVPHPQVMSQALGKLHQDKTESILVAHVWQDATWCRQLLIHVVDKPVPCPPRAIRIIQTGKFHPFPDQGSPPSELSLTSGGSPMGP